MEIQKFRKICLSFGIISISIISGALVSLNITKLFYIHDHTGFAEWRDSNGQKFLYVEAEDYYSLGYLQGKFLSKQILNTRIILHDIFGFLPKEYAKLVKEYDHYIPEKYRDEMIGIAHGVSRSSGLTFQYKDILLQNLIIELIYGQYFANSLTFGCSSIAIDNSDVDSKKNNQIIYGQNFDFPKIIGQGGLFESISWVLTNLTVDNNKAVFSLRIGGIIGSSIGKSSAGIASLTNVVDSKYRGAITVPMSIRYREAFENSKDLEEFEDYILEYNQTYAYNLIIANETHSRGYQFTPNNHHYFNNLQYLNFTNRYYNESWNNLYLNDVEYSRTRQQHLDHLVSQNIDLIGHKEESILNILSNDENLFGPDSSILMYNDISATLAFITNRYFGLGNIRDSNLGLIPL